MSDEERNVMTWACNLTDSIIAGQDKMPKEMIWCLNNLQDAVYKYLGKNGLKLKDMVSREYVEFRDRERHNRDNIVRRMYEKYSI